MAENPTRRAGLADAGITVLAERGARGLTHRAVDEVAQVPRGTCANYFRSRADLITALVDRIETRLTATPEFLEPLAGRTPDKQLYADYLKGVIGRLLADPHVALALFELRLEAARRPELASALGAWRRRSFADDVAFAGSAGLPGGPTEIALLHFAVDGLVLDHLTVPLDADLDVNTMAEALATRILP